MKEMIRFAGRAFLSATVGLAVWAVIYFAVVRWSGMKKINTDDSMSYNALDIAYKESKAENDIVLEWIFREAISQNTFLEAEKYFRATDKTGKSIEISVLSVLEEETLNPVTCENGEYHFVKSGIYQVYIQCKDTTFIVRIPVNVLEDGK